MQQLQEHPLTNELRSVAFKVEYKKGFEESKTHFHLPMDMVNLRHAKKAQALASDLGYRKKLHGYTVPPEDMRIQWAKKAYGLQSEVSGDPLTATLQELCSQSDLNPVHESVYNSAN